MRNARGVSMAVSRDPTENWGRVKGAIGSKPGGNRANIKKDTRLDGATYLAPAREGPRKGLVKWTVGLGGGERGEGARSRNMRFGIKRG